MGKNMDTKYNKCMYAIAFDLDTAQLELHYAKTNLNAYNEVRHYLETNHFTNKQGSVYYGDETVTMVTAITTVTQMGHLFPWLVQCIADIRILQILNNDDLYPAIKLGASI